MKNIHSQNKDSFLKIFKWAPVPTVTLIHYNNSMFNTLPTLYYIPVTKSSKTKDIRIT